MLKKPIVYVESTVINYLFEENQSEKRRDTWMLWDEIKAGKYAMVIADTVVLEIMNCPDDLEKKWKMIDELNKVNYTLTTATESEKANTLAKLYISAGGLPPKCKNDALHIAAATLANCDFIVSWNFNHIVNIRAMTAVDAVNAAERLKPVKLVSPTNFLREE
ncbi:hypothetical protein AGMMS49959_19330 [Planctomycetales bacterium]|nr:hypothetical protein AGMMS49959_19330 [Planctomycetales bacterium]